MSALVGKFQVFTSRRILCVCDSQVGTAEGEVSAAIVVLQRADSKCHQCDVPMI